MSSSSPWLLPPDLLIWKGGEEGERGREEGKGAAGARRVPGSFCLRDHRGRAEPTQGLFQPGWSPALRGHDSQKGVGAGGEDRDPETTGGRRSASKSFSTRRKRELSVTRHLLRRRTIHSTARLDGTGVKQGMNSGVSGASQGRWIRSPGLARSCVHRSAGVTSARLGPRP